MTVSNLIAIASLVSEIWLAMESHTHTHGLVYINFFKLLKIFDKKHKMIVFYNRFLLDGNTLA